ncbi:TPA: hypothetical protein DIU27_05450 [Candidatus Collierbacteria bacterium]|uniref:Uncharacterized protein n=1 Tax=Candidatus Collierbacteria bacterium GW2011_GWB2_44_22 TaxID=1618387 RepID=A0A0G1KVH0_9BACT|nr:MAG: hypothetical protein UW31_C0002G0060 [Candidatus Collierbacteria bacterium GW2011_GWA2_44_13]KKT51919.1 MAG: hypothetical protein UW44_C0006G0037 [Candidatus Collierbacteria bacterium GW2011_GWB2_44_22]KKT61869.1 MAG: hypothetical protein UW56_C0016G0003 [Candidatus Collierbacteria bacterium GW2011_GWD1_44_27]KKT64447.1 MAG: hypothetical protein UW58_C0043G0004 [Candidatus Collierbacteria bacterium GW2011_GWC2_44_30]HCQ31787.1 hypothetical protein [Candidatus Collierbacteria bacterium]
MNIVIAILIYLIMMGASVFLDVRALGMFNRSIWFKIVFGPIIMIVLGFVLYEVGMGITYPVRLVQVHLFWGILALAIEGYLSSHSRLDYNGWSLRDQVLPVRMVLGLGVVLTAGYLMILFGKLLMLPVLLAF